MRGLLGPALVVAALAGCGGGGASGDTDNSAQKFSGVERQQAQVVEDFSDAAARSDWARICDELYTADKAELTKGLLSDSCEDALKDDLEDNNDMNLTVTRVVRLGGTVNVQSKDDEGNNQSFEVVEQGGRWRIDSYGGTFGAD